jgi:hypothetical protein
MSALVSAATFAFADRRFALYLVGVLGAEAAAQITFIALAWQVFLIGHRAFDLGLIGFAMFLPALLLTLASGVVADRFDRSTVVVAGRAADMTCGGVLVALVLLHVGVVWPYLAVALVLGGSRALARPAEKTLLPNLVAGERFIKAQAAYVTMRELIVIIGPAVGGGLLALAAVAAFGTAVALSAISALAFANLRVPNGERAAAPASWRTALEGIAFLRTRPAIAGAITLDLFAVLFGGATAVLPIYADTILHVGPAGLGALRSAPSVGAVLVAAYLTRHPLERGVGGAAFAAVFGFGVATIVFALSTTMWISLLALAIMGGFDIVGGVVRNGLVQLNTPDAMRGRVIAIQAIFTTTSNELGAFESGTAAALIGTVPSVVAGGLAALVVGAACARAFPALWRAERFQLEPERG